MEHQNLNAAARMPEDSFEQLYQHYAPRVWQLAYRMTFNPQVAEDLTQEIFLKLFQKYDQFRGDAHVYTWIYRLAVNHILNYLKREKRFRLLQLLDMPITSVLKEDSRPVLQIADPSPTPLQHVEQQELTALVRNAIRQLPPKLRAPFVLHRYEKFSHKEIAEMLNISVSAVETRIHRATKQINRQLEKHIKP